MLGIYTVGFLYVVKCERKQQDWMYDRQVDDNSLCQCIFDIKLKLVNDDNFQVYNSAGYAAYSFLLLLPVLVFFGFDDPHDCFVCFGKDPDRKYSRF